ncbi:MarR family winged helix-turn-helix transcriptional regulator [Neorhizobium sp. CSC1952]|uniref:DNA-binding transcriptional regulator, MarR family n=1 Tax=Xaviernesmea oryzae TaxID=464029 RepID=A0A1X7CJT7_9HYPH|nr:MULTISPECIES: MarR family winged helix-turn-helix transcriptional regulator [Rhizobium/Agrobacterium group]WJR69245.1 MarR family winged helix-turn-helix transcriptional regulator [Rhizobium sp. CSC1952]SME97403.1 DNA-binding transcriptional regulator, MarR family [Xaviernesmea oryzae]
MDTLGFLIVDSARLLRTAFERRIAQAGLGLTPGEARALLNIAAVDGSRQLDIAARMGVEPMTLCAYLDKLQSLGLIERQQCSLDRRAKRITLTETSEEMIASVRKELNVILVQATEGLSEENNRALRETLAAFNTNLQALSLSQIAQTASDEG